MKDIERALSPAATPVICQRPHVALSCSMNWLRLISNIVIVGLALWAIYVTVTALFGVTVYFPFRVAGAESIPEHRWQSARLAVFVTFAYYAVIHLVNGSREVYPIHFLKVYLFALTGIGTLVFIRAGVPLHEYLVPVFFGACSLLLHIASKPRFKKYFVRK